ncbi:hypothetical protein BDV19DRAFT_392855 [Aspergillus venezuelensis]
MKFSIAFLSLLATSQVTLASPITSVDAVNISELPSDIGLEIRSPNPASEPLAILEQRTNGVCQVLDRTIRTIGTSKFTVIYIVAVTRLAQQVCELAGGNRSSEISFVISNALSLAYGAAAHHSGAIPEGLPSKREVEDYPYQWDIILSTLEDVSYEILTALSVSDSSETVPLARRQDEPLPTQRLQINGFALAGSPKHEIIANYYDNGATILHLSLPDGGSGANGTEGSALTTKISFSTKARTKLTQAHQKFMALAGAATWAVYANNSGHKMDDFIGFAETGHAANFYYRIIPEVRGFGTNYESVDVCGGMASYL